MAGGLRAWWERLVGNTFERSGPGGGFHLWWQGVPTDEPVVACSVTLEVLQEPVVERLYFWALQASFTDASGRNYGAAHTGLQWNPRHPDHRAVNWGGYASAADVRSVLEGTDSALPGIPGDRNTRNYPWREGVPYRFTIRRGAQGWAADVHDGATGETVRIRELFAEGDRLRSFVMWSELFCRGDDPTAVVRWSRPEVETASGRRVPPKALQATFPGGEEWKRLDVVSDDVGVMQVTDTRRTARNMSILRVPGSQAGP
jgi:hypothetical protein